MRAGVSRRRVDLADALISMSRQTAPPGMDFRKNSIVIYRDTQTLYSAQQSIPFLE